MSEISEKFEDYMNNGVRAYINLNPDKEMNPYTITYPITWSGNIAGHEVIIVQEHASSNLIDDYDFKVFPSVYNPLKSDIVKLIDKHLRNMD
jgi:hypothetical protein